jgi:hypothetical protein
VRVFGLRVPPPVARFIRFRLREIRKWPAESFLLLGKHLYVRSWLLESPRTLERLSSGSLSLDDLSDLKVWRPWWMVAPTMRTGASVLTCEPSGRWGNRVVQAALGLAAAEVFHAKYLLLRSDDFGRGVSQRLDNGVTFVGVNAHGARVHDRAVVPQSGVVIEANWLLSQSAFRDRRHVIEGFRALREAELEITQSVAKSDCDLVIHFRGTDQLTQDWRPPPLSFFVKSALHSQAASVLLVTDDPDNLLVRDLVDRLKNMVSPLLRNPPPLKMTSPRSLALPGCVSESAPLRHLWLRCHALPALSIRGNNLTGRPGLTWWEPSIFDLM